MNFITAILHAGIGYGIRRKVWRDGVMLSISAYELVWVAEIDKEGKQREQTSDVCKILGSDPTWDLGAEDLTALDWETI